MDEIKGIAGSSAGSSIAVLISIGICKNEFMYGKIIEGVYHQKYGTNHKISQQKCNLKSKRFINVFLMSFWWVLALILAPFLVFF